MLRGGLRSAIKIVVRGGRDRHLVDREISSLDAPRQLAKRGLDFLSLAIILAHVRGREATTAGTVARGPPDAAIVR